MNRQFYLICMLTLLSFLFHWFTPSYFNNHVWPSENQEHFSHSLKDHINGHMNYNVFKKRIVFTFFLKEISHVTGLEKNSVYYPLQFFFLFLGALTLLYISKKLGHSPPVISINISVYFLTLSNFFHHFVPMYTYDELAQYAFALFGIYCVYSEKHIPYACLSMVVALLARESFFILFPFLSYYHFYKTPQHRLRNSKAWYNFFILLVIPTLFWMAYYYINEFSEISDRFEHYQRNFASSKIFFTGLFGFWMNCALPLLLIFFNRRMNFTKDHQINVWFNAYIGATIFNAVIVFLSTQAWESRLFIIPNYMIWPFIGKLIYQRVGFIKLNIQSLILLTIIALASYHAYYHHHAMFRRGYAFYFVVYNMLIYAYLIAMKKHLRISLNFTQNKTTQ